MVKSVSGSIKAKVVSDKIRGFSKGVREQKEAAATSLIKGLSDASTGFLINFYVYKIIAEFFGLIAHAFKAFKEDEGIQLALKTMVANIIEDVASRINEFANLVDKVGAHPRVMKSIEAVNDAVEEFKAEAEALQKEQQAQAEALQKEQQAQAAAARAKVVEMAAAAAQEVAEAAREKAKEKSSWWYFSKKKEEPTEE
jgi:wyosine [tRNA(Phe)-imidazoG37] synthetase (radical SAM superfamily)